MHSVQRDKKAYSTSEEKRARRRKLFFRLAAAALAMILLCGIAAFALDASIRKRTSQRILAIDAAAALDADCILVLGAGVRDNGSPSHMLEDRLKTGIALHEAGVSSKMLMSGDHGRAAYNEVGVMKRFAVEQGIEDSDVFMDHAGFSTYESLYRARDVFGAEKIIIVTQKYHLYRALYIAESLGLEAWGVSADLRSYVGQPIRETREIAARLKDALWCTIRVKPTYLGEAIPLSGDGNATNDGAYEAGNFAS